MPRSLLLALVLASLVPAQNERGIRPETETYPKLTGARVPRSYALVIGINYRRPDLPKRWNLDFAERDARELYTTLISAGGGQFPAENVHRLIGDQATLESIKNELENWLPSVTQSTDRVLIFVSMHGVVAEGREYLAPYDVDPQNVTATGYPMDRLSAIFSTRIKGKWRVLLADACHSGAVLTPSEAEQFSQRLLNIGASIFSLSASRGDEEAVEHERWGGGHGVFTYYLLNGMAGEADSSSDGVVTARELADYVQANVRFDTNGRQTPTYIQGTFDPNMILGYNPSNAGASTPRPSYGSIAVSTLTDSVEVFIERSAAETLVEKTPRGVATIDKPLTLTGIAPGTHFVWAVRSGYQTAGPIELRVYPGQDEHIEIPELAIQRKNPIAERPYKRGLAYYQSGGRANYERAVTEFSKAIALDANFSEAALRLATSLNALSDSKRAEASFRHALVLDPGSADAHALFGAALLDSDRFDEAIRHLDRALQIEPNHVYAYYLLSIAFRRKGAHQAAIREARTALRVAPGVAEPHLWLAEALRFSGDCTQANAEYGRYLSLSEFDSKLAGKAWYWLLGVPKTRAGQHDIWAEMRSQANFGICDCAMTEKQWGRAIQYCETALKFDRSDPFTHYNLGVILLEQFNTGNDFALLTRARTYFNDVIDYSAKNVIDYGAKKKTREAEDARKYIEQIDSLLKGPRGR